MADYLTTDTELTSIANAIRTKGGTSAQLTYPAGFVSAINAIPTGGATWTEHIDQDSSVNVVDFYLDDYVDYHDETTIWRIKIHDLWIDSGLNVGGNGEYTDTEFIGIGGAYSGYIQGTLATDGGSNYFFVNMEAGSIVAYQIFAQDYNGVTDGDVISFKTLSST